MTISNEQSQGSVAEQAIHQLEELLDSPAAQADQAKLQLVLASAGRLVLTGGLERARSIVQRHPAWVRYLEASWPRFDLEFLEDASIAILQSLDELSKASPEQLQRILGALQQRDHAEFWLVAAEALLGRSPELSEEQETYLLQFEMTVRPELWRLVALNDQRGEAIAWVAPTERARLWWWFEGVDVAPSAVDALSQAAHLIARFPQARAELERQLQVHRLLVQAVQQRQPVPVDDQDRVLQLGDWIRARKAAALGLVAADLPLAAGFEAEELRIHRQREFELSFRQPDQLLVDMLEDLLEGTLPELSLDAGCLVSVPVEGCVQRYCFTLEDSHWLSRRARLTLRLVEGTLELELTRLLT